MKFVAPPMVLFFGNWNPSEVLFLDVVNKPEVSISSGLINTLHMIRSDPPIRGFQVCFLHVWPEGVMSKPSQI